MSSFRRRAVNTCAFRILFFSIAIAFCIVPADFLLGIEAESVLVIYNADQGPSGPGSQIANYYSQARPGVHLLGVSLLDAQGESVLSGQFGEDISASDYLRIHDPNDPLSFDGLRKQVLDGIAGLPASIDVIVTTKGMPLRLDAGTQPPGDPSLNWKRYSSLESELTRIDSIDSPAEMGNQWILAGFPDYDTNLASNPYYNASTPDEDNLPFTRVGSDPVNGDIRLSSRLDGYSVEAVKRSIDRAQRVFIVPNGHYVVADDDPTAGIDQIVNQSEGPAGDGPGPGLVNHLQAIGQVFQSDYDQEDAVQNLALTSASGPVIGYVSHGTNDGGAGLSSDYLGKFVSDQFEPGELQFDIADGAVFLTHESFNSQSYDPASTQTQGMIADWLEIGGTAGLGHVAEPLNGRDNVTNEDIFFQRLLPSGGASAAPGATGLTFVEAAWNATRQLSYMNTVVGDPLMRFTSWLPGDTNLDGSVEFNDFYTLQGNWLQAGSFSDGDFTGDGFIDSADFEILEDNWLASVCDSACTVEEASEVIIQVIPILDPNEGVPQLLAVLLNGANLNGDLNVDGEDLVVLTESYGTDSAGDVDGDGDTDALDFLAWQRSTYTYDLQADFDFSGYIDANDMVIWENSYGKNMGGDANNDAITDARDFLALQREVSIRKSSHLAFVTTVPEPSTVLLVTLGVIGLVSSRYR